MEKKVNSKSEKVKKVKVKSARHSVVSNSCDPTDCGPPRSSVCGKEDLNNTINQLVLTDVYKDPTVAKRSFILGACGAFITIDHILDHKTIFSKF